MIRKSSDIILATSFLGTVLLPIASRMLQGPFIPANMELIAMVIANLCIYSALGLLLGIASGCAIISKRRGNLIMARNIHLGSGVLAAGWLEFYTLLLLFCFNFSDYQHLSRSLWITIEVSGELPAWLWAIALIVLGVVDHHRSQRLGIAESGFRSLD